MKTPRIATFETALTAAADSLRAQYERYGYFSGEGNGITFLSEITGRDFNGAKELYNKFPLERRTLLDILGAMDTRAAERESLKKRDECGPDCPGCKCCLEREDCWRVPA